MQNALWLNLEVATGQRGGSYIESNAYVGSDESLWYKDTRLYLERTSDGSTEFRLAISLRFMKGERVYARELNGDNLVVIPFYENEIPFRNCVLFFIALALADDAFKHYSNVAEIVGAKIRPGKQTHTFEWKESVELQPVFKTIGPNGPTQSSATYSTMQKFLVTLGYRAGYQANMTIHAIRRAFLTKADEFYTPAQRNHIARHSGKDSSMFQSRYISNVSVVDGQAIMYGQQPRKDHVSGLHSMLRERRLDVPQHLPAEYEEKMLLNSDSYKELDRQLSEVNQLISRDRGNQQLKRRRTDIYKKKSKLKQQAKQQYQKEQANLRPDEQSSDEENSLSITARAERFRILREFMPARDRLATSLFQHAYIQSHEGKHILDDLLSLCLMDISTFFRPGEEPIDDCCPFNGCGRAIGK